MRLVSTLEGGVVLSDIITSNNAATSDMLGIRIRHTQNEVIGKVKGGDLMASREKRHTERERERELERER